jgi:hypothetical protein
MYQIGKAISAVKLVSDDLSKAMGCAQKVACAYEEMKEDARVSASLASTC